MSDDQRPDSGSPSGDGAKPENGSTDPTDAPGSYIILVIKYVVFQWYDVVCMNS